MLRKLCVFGDCTFIDISRKRVLLVDADQLANLTVSLDIKHPDELQVSLSTVMQAVIEDKLLPQDSDIFK